MNKVILPLIIIIYLILITILIINLYKKNKYIKYSYLFFFLFTFTIIFCYDLTILDEILYHIIKYIYYPTYYSCVLTILFMIIMFIYTIINKKLSNKEKIINYVFGGLVVISYIIFLTLNIDILEYKLLYSSYSLLCLRLITRSFTIWLIIKGIIKYYNIFRIKV